MKRFILLWLFVVQHHSRESQAFLTAVAFASPVVVLSVGGYYADPEELPMDQSKTHMIFGIRSVETTTVVQGQVIIGLQPAVTNHSTNNNEDDVVDYGQAIIDYLQTHGMDWTDRSVVEIGASSTCLAACMGASSVQVLHPDLQRLRLLEHAQLFFNAQSFKCPLKTAQLSEDQPLPPADFVIFTDKIAISRLNEALQMKCRVLLPLAIVSPEHLRELNSYRESNGVVEILG